MRLPVGHLAALRQPLVRACGREERGVGLDPDARQVEPVGIPAGADGRVVGDEPVRVLEAGEAERLELRRRCPEQPLRVQLGSERGGARPVLWVAAVVLAHRVVQKREEEDHVRVRPVERLREPEPVRADGAPVQLTVDVGRDAGAAGADLVDEGSEWGWVARHSGILAQLPEAPGKVAASDDIAVRCDWFAERLPKVDGSHLHAGLHEALLTTRVARAVEALDPSLLAERSNLSDAEAPDRLSRHIAWLIADAIRGLPDEERARAGARLVSRVIQALEGLTPQERLGEEALIEPPAVLNAVLRTLPDGTPERIERPLTPLLDTTVFTNARGEPAVRP